jgi:hypothetical protein
LTFDLEELNCRNKDLDVGLDALRSTLDLFLHKTCLLAKFMCHLRKIISLSYELFFLLKFGRLIGLQVRNPKTLSLHLMDFSSLRYSSRNGQRQYWKNARFVFEGCDFHAFSLFIFLTIYL